MTRGRRPTTRLVEHLEEGDSILLNGGRWTVEGVGDMTDINGAWRLDLRAVETNDYIQIDRLPGAVFTFA